MSPSVHASCSGVRIQVSACRGATIQTIDVPTTLVPTFEELDRAVGADLDARQSTAVGTLLLTNLRGLVATQLIMGRTVDTARDRSTLVEVVCTYIDRNR